MPNTAQRDLIVRHIASLDRLCAQTPDRDRASDQAMLVLISKMLMTLPSKQNEVAAEAKADAYAAALDDVPVWAIDAAIRGWYRGSYGPGHDYEWAPAPATLRKLSMAEAWRVSGDAAKLRNILLAEPRREFTEEHRAAMVDRVTRLVGSMRHGTSKPVPDLNYSARSLADLEARRAARESSEAAE